jgi:microcystin-dependent protein
MGTGWLLADGSEVSRTTYANLFAAIGTRYGDGDTTTTFNLPDARGRSPIGAGAGAGGLTFRDANSPYIGEENHAQTIAEMPVHHHSWNGPDSRVVPRDAGAGQAWNGTLADVTGDTGLGNPFNVVHPALVLFAWIKT